MNWLIASNVGLFAAVLALGAVVLSLARQIGVLHERTAPGGAALRRIRESQLPDPNALTVTDLTGTVAPLGEFASGRALAMLFVGPDCPVCKALLPDFEAAVRHLGLLPCYAGAGVATDEHRRYAQDRALDPKRYFIGTELPVALQVMHTPALVVIDSAGRVALRETLRGPAHLQAVAARLNRARRADGSFGNRPGKTHG